MADSRVDELRRRLAREPGSRLFAQLAEEHRKAGEHLEAIRVARAGLAQHPVYPSARLTLGRALLESGDFAGARQELEEALREAPDNILASRFLGQALEASGDLTSALQRYEATLKMAPGDRQLETQIRAVKARLEEQRYGGGNQPPSPTRPMPRIEPAVLTPAGGDGRELPPTIRLRIAVPPVQPGSGQVPVVTAADSARQVVAPGGEAATEATSKPKDPPGVAVAEQEAPGDAGSREPVARSAPAPTAPAGPAAARGQGPTAVPGSASPNPSPPAVPSAQAAPKAPELASDTEDSGSGTAPFWSSTLAELYLRQGLPERATEVYRMVLAEDPSNRRAQARLAEIERALSSRAPLAASVPEDGRRRSLERVIAGLEAFLGAVRRR